MLTILATGGTPMPLITNSDADVFETHGVRFSSYVRPSRGSGQLCAWRVDVPAGLTGAPHRPSREEVICCIGGELTISLDGGPDGGAAWTTSLAGLEATMSDGSQLRPPWTL